MIVPDECPECPGRRPQDRRRGTRYDAPNRNATAAWRPRRKVRTEAVMRNNRKTLARHLLLEVLQIDRLPPVWDGREEQGLRAS